MRHWVCIFWSLGCLYSIMTALVLVAIEGLTIHSAALCQVFDSIYMDVPMSRVKFNVNSEYAYVQNFKVLQSQSLALPNNRLRRSLTYHRHVYQTSD
jgi:hypothetical protein